MWIFKNVGLDLNKGFLLLVITDCLNVNLGFWYTRDIILPLKGSVYWSGNRSPLKTSCNHWLQKYPHSNKETKCIQYVPWHWANHSAKFLQRVQVSGLGSNLANYYLIFLLSENEEFWQKVQSLWWCQWTITYPSFWNWKRKKFKISIFIAW